jgi:uncharacterized protein (DUF934 family)
MPLVKKGAIAEDAWITLADDDAAPAKGDIVVGYARLLKEAVALKARKGRLGVRVGSSEDVLALAPHLKALTLVALEFPKFGDGRAFSSARLLRERLGYTGEVRAVGDVLRDQLFYMVRCGFDAFEIPRTDAAELFAQAMAEQNVFYQAASDDRRPVWRKRLAKTAAAAE